MKHYDLIVVGGGLTGVCAAVGGARMGLSTLLIERAGCLGGALSNCLVYPFMKYATPVDGEEKVLCTGLFADMRRREQAYGMDRGLYKFHPDYFKLILDDMLVEAGVEVLFHTTVYGLETDGRSITALHVSNVAGCFDFAADFFVDATGDGNLFTMAGCDFQLGRESDSRCQPMTTCFRMCGVDTDTFYEEKPRLQEIYKEAQARGEITNPRENILTFRGIGDGVLHFNTTRVVKHDPTDPFELSRAAITSRHQIHEMLCFLRKHSKAFDNATLVNVANEVGVRESRKLRGVHILNEQELLDLTMFEDRIALGNYNIDIHSPDGTGTYLHYFKEGEYYSIPYRALLPKEYDNMLVAGRCLSATHEAHSAVRVMPICACMGEAAGTAAAIARADNANFHTLDIKKLQDTLRAYGAAL